MSRGPEPLPIFISLSLSEALTESELKRQLSHDLANDPALATVFNPPQIFSDTDAAHGSSSGGIPTAAGLGSTVVVHWTNNDIIVSSYFISSVSIICRKVITNLLGTCD